MRNKQQIGADLFSALETTGDASFRDWGFKRRSNSLIYKRDFKDAKHSIEFAVDFLPAYETGAELHIHPLMQLSIKSVSDAALQLVAGNKMLLADAPDVIVNQPIEFTAPRDVHARWFATGIGQINEKISEIVAFTGKWVMPFINELGTSKDLVQAYTDNDGRMLKQRHWYLFVAAAEMEMGNLHKAMSVLENNFSGYGLKKRYAVAFDTLISLQ